jgi:hypothetical protein
MAFELILTFKKARILWARSGLRLNELFGDPVAIASGWHPHVPPTPAQNHASTTGVWSGSHPAYDHAGTTSFERERRPLGSTFRVTGDPHNERSYHAGTTDNPHNERS